MKLTDITTGTVYALRERYGVNRPGVAVLAEAWSYRHQRVYGQRDDADDTGWRNTWEPSPTGRGYGKIDAISSLDVTYRGVPTVTTSPHSLDAEGEDDDGADLARRIAALPVVAAAVAEQLRAGLTTTSPALPSGYRFELARPQDYLYAWEQELADQAARAQANEQARQREIAQIEQRAAARERVTALLGPDVALPYEYQMGALGWDRLETLLEAYHAAKLAARP